MNTNHKAFQEFRQALNLLGRIDSSVDYLTESLKKKAILDDKKENARYIPMTPGGLGYPLIVFLLLFCLLMNTGPGDGPGVVI